ncbi:hypothetical protein Scep_007563 [Stephania cephalantha]|uniref:Uncharacterized protein n=1 Tax=Stephania cephalantha TaxID=152367 RepID=A0AAP0KA53_9MAGN
MIGKSCLKSLCIVGCEELTFQYEGLQHLQFLEFSKCSWLKFLHVQICNLTSLKSLKIKNCDKLASLPHELSRLISLECLEILHCCRLRSLLVMEMQGQNSYLKELCVVMLPSQRGFCHYSEVFPSSHFHLFFNHLPSCTWQQLMSTLVTLKSTPQPNHSLRKARPISHPSLP